MLLSSGPLSWERTALVWNQGRERTRPEAYLDVIHEDVLVPGPAQRTSIMTDLEEAPLLG